MRPRSFGMELQTTPAPNCTPMTGERRLALLGKEGLGLRVPYTFRKRPGPLSRDIHDVAVRGNLIQHRQ
jgi:hypothetical protein